METRRTVTHARRLVRGSFGTLSGGVAHDARDDCNRVRVHGNLAQHIAKMALPDLANVMLNQTQRRTFTNFNDAAQLPGKVGRCYSANKDNVNERLNRHTGGDADNRTIAGQRGIEPGENL